jgi:hypothetical protein
VQGFYIVAMLQDQFFAKWSRFELRVCSFAGNRFSSRIPDPDHAYLVDHQNLYTSSLGSVPADLSTGSMIVR